MIDKYDDKEVYCRKLGHHVHFEYCRGVQDRQPCSRIMDCWFETIPVQDYVLKHYKESIEDIFTPPAPKVTSILEIVERVKQQ